MPFFFLCYDFFHGIFSNNDNSKTVQALTLILARNGCSSQCAASQPSAPSSLQIHPGQQKPFTTLLGCCPLLTTPFSNFVRMRTRSLVPRPKTTIISLEARLVHRRNGQLPVRMAGTEAGTVFPKVYAIHGFSPPVALGKAYEHHVDKALPTLKIAYSQLLIMNCKARGPSRKKSRTSSAEIQKFRNPL